ncbi:MAG: ABC transporter permease subunit [Planctomycetota bacterium]|nr:ABC transporter permease subunit [Planctomycetota bacterium]
MELTWKNVWLILHREVRDQLRDRRTLFMVLILPIMLYPGLGIGMLQMTMYFTEQPRQVVILNAGELPDPPLVEAGAFPARWFRSEETSSKLSVLTDSPDDKTRLPNVSEDEQTQLLADAARIRDLIEQRNKLVVQLAPWNADLADELPGVQSASLRNAIQQGETPEQPENYASMIDEYLQLKKTIGEAFANSKLQVLMIVPEGFAENLKSINTLLADRSVGNDALMNLPLLRPILVRNRADEKSDVAYRRVREAIDKWERQLLKDRLELAQLPETVPDPVNLLSIDVANEEEIAASMWGKIFPALLIIMALTGAFYPAIDVAAGEKERGTMETLLICPATRSEIVVGKFLTVLLFSMSTTMLNLISMGITGQYIVSMTAGAGSAMSGMGAVPLPTPLALFWLVVLLIPLAAFFSALCLSLATFARSNKEGQYYLTPLFMVTMGMTMFSMSPSIELTATGGASLFYCAMPIVGPALLLKALLMNPGNTEVLVFALPVLMSSIGYSLIALWWAVEQFKSEDVLFREAEQFDLKLWLRHLLRDKAPLPTFAMAAGCFMLMMFLQFLTIKLLTGSMIGVTAENLGKKMMQLAVVQQAALIAAPAIFMAILFTSSARKTLRLRMPSGRMLAVAIALPFVLHPLAIELLASLQSFFPQLPDSAKAAFAAMSDDTLPLYVVIGVFALTPALCEEVAFRGFILSGFGSGGRTGVAIVLSSVTFGLIHMVPQQVFNASLLGMVLGLIAVRSNSLLPGVAFHLCFNSLAVFHGQASASFSESKPDWLDNDIISWFVSCPDDTLRYNFLTLMTCAGAAFLMIRWLTNQGESRNDTNALPRVQPEAVALAGSAT